jgi:hypothetical protein
MQVSDLFIELEEKDNILGIYSELIAHLGQFEGNDDMQIPREGSTTEFVDPDTVREFITALKRDQERVRVERTEVLSWHVVVPEDEDGG